MRLNIEDTSRELFPAPLKAQQALDILCGYLLGDNWSCSAGSEHVEQLNAIITEQILDKYSKQWRRDWNHYEKHIENYDTQGDKE